MLNPTFFTYQSRLLVTFEPVTDINKIKQQWEQLYKFRTNIFLSWAWMESWLKAIKDKALVYVLYLHNADKELVGSAFLVKEKTKRRLFFALNHFSLNEAMTIELSFTIEYNNILHNPKYREDVFFSFFDFLKNGPLEFDELQIHAADDNETPSIESLAKSVNLKYLCEKNSNANFVDLKEFAHVPDLYISKLSKSKREQVRRSIRYFKQFGEMNFEVAENPAQALEFFTALGTLHQQYWTQKGHPGSFANSVWVDFHKLMISNFFHKTRIIKLSYGKHIVGYLYNFIDCETEYSIQSGFNYSEDKNNRPGLVLHYYAIKNAISENLKNYDFLVGDTQYKRSLSNAYNSCSWIQIQNNTHSILLERVLVYYVRLLKKASQKVKSGFTRFWSAE